MIPQCERDWLFYQHEFITYLKIGEFFRLIKLPLSEGSNAS